MRIEPYGEGVTELVVSVKPVSSRDGTCSFSAYTQDTMRGTLFRLTSRGLVLSTYVPLELGFPLDDKGRIKVIE